MKRIVLVRHAKAEDIYDNITDFDRALTKKGNNDSFIIAKRIKSLNIFPGLVISSPASRAFETAINFVKELNYSDEKIILENNLYYNFNADKLLKYIKTINKEFENIFIFGHNPTLTYFANILLKKDYISLPKCGAVGILFKMENWNEINEAEREKVFYEFP